MGRLHHHRKCDKQTSLEGTCHEHLCSAFRHLSFLSRRQRFISYFHDCKYSYQQAAQRMRVFTGSVFIVLFQGSLSIFYGKDWKFPSTINALIGSCVEIPCTYPPPKSMGAASVAWYRLHLNYMHIFDSRANSLVESQYRNRTSLVPGKNSCTLRIDPVRKEDRTSYYPGIAERPQDNAFSQGLRYVWLSVKDSPQPPTITIPEYMTAGRPVNITCSANHTCGSSPPIITWNKPGQIRRRSEDLLGGYWRENSELAYNPTLEDDGTVIQCKIRHHNGYTLQREARLDIQYAAAEVEVIKSRTTEGAIELKCSFLSSRPAVTHYTWIKNGFELKEKKRILQIDKNSYKSVAYTCIAHNAVGSSTSAEVVITGYELQEGTVKKIYVIFMAVFGFFCLAFLAMTIHFYRRLKLRRTSPKQQNPQPQNSTYDVLMKTEASNEYDTLMNPQLQNSTYADLMKTEASNDYDTIMPALLSKPFLQLHPRLNVVADQHKMRITKKILLLTLLQGLVCQEWEFPSKIDGLVGSCVEIPCTFRPRENPGTSSTVWYLYQRRGYPQIFNSQENSSVLMDYKDRTSLVPGNNSCSLIIDPVRREDGNKYYYPGIAGDEYTNAYSQRSMYLQLHVTDDPTIPELTGNKEMLEGHSETFQCSVEHTCGSNPPSLKWNKDGQTERRSEDLSGGKWREILTITYIPSHEDDKTQMKCTATYHNGEKLYKATTLNIKYAPKDVTAHYPENEEFMEGSDVILTCSSNSNPPAQRYEWYYGHRKMKLRLEERITVQNVLKDTEPYSCAAINDVGRGESPPTQIPVRYAATGVQVIVFPTEGATELNCSFVSSNPNVSHYTWIKDGKSLLNKTNQILVLDSNEENSGSYSCIAHNTAGSSTSAELDFKDTPRISKLTENGKMLEGRPEIFACSVVHTSVSNPPSLEWNKPGQTERRSEDLSGGKWREILTITYIPSHEDDKTQMKCTATYHNGEKSYKATTLNIKYSKANLILILGIVAGVILLILIVYIVTRNKVCQTSIRHENSQLDNTYMILMKTETSFPAQPEPGGRDSTSGNLYETLQTKK
ncbi:B-cell receptor CD22-like [Lithobates pipiens]